jgi:hypothetical protein
MRAALENADAGATKIDRIKNGRTESNAGEFIFPAICRRLWPDKTAIELATIGDSHPRTAEFWLSGKVEPPPIVYAVAWAEVIRRDREAREIARR